MVDIAKLYKKSNQATPLSQTEKNPVASGRRVFTREDKAFADDLLKGITRDTAGSNAPGAVAHAMLSVAGWPAWWAAKKCRDKVAADPDPDAFSLHGKFGD